MREKIENKIQKLYKTTNSGILKDVNSRLNYLKKLRSAIIHNQHKIELALYEDLKKSPQEAFLTEIAMVLKEVNLHISKLKKWAKPKKVSTPIYINPSRSRIIYEPMGVALIIAPWNYPFNLLMTPLIGAISAGCAAMLKTAEIAPATAHVVDKIIREVFDEGHVEIVHGGKIENTILLEQKFDIIFFTGSPRLGKIVYKAASETLTPVVLELGGKSPCIVDQDANLKLAARRIAWGKLINAGQTCVAPDYVYVHKSLKDRFLQQLVVEIERMYGSNAQQSEYYPRLISSEAFDRAVALLKGEQIYYGGSVDRDEKYISPTILTSLGADSPVMCEEIFAPILPVLDFEDVSEAIDYINSHEKPLALYYFGSSAQSVLKRTSSGGACVNDTIMHVSNNNLPFGGVGNSGLGRYHGQESFLCFSNTRSVVYSPT